MPAWVPQVPVAVNLRRLFPSASYVGCGDIITLHATDDSRNCTPQSLFAVIRGPQFDGHDFLNDAIANGASALLVDHPLPGVNLPQCIVADVRRSYAELCAALMAHPHRRLGLAGVTGTNGKTTTTWLIRAILQNSGCQTGALGTVEYHDGIRREAATLTTPDSNTYARWLADMVAVGTTHAAMELSSHALDQRRTAGTLLDAAVITNITQDHFDYHQTSAAYRRSKLRIFDLLKPAGMCILNADDAGSRGCLEDAPKRVITFGMQNDADVTGTLLEESLEGTRFRLQIGMEVCEARTHLIGRHNVSNCLAAAAVAWQMQIPLDEIAQGLESLIRVPGRLEAIPCGQPYHTYVDYAHTDDALKHGLSCLRTLTDRRVICVFGAGGDRDKTKRPLMGQAAVANADVIIVTSDNPRSEDPAAIARDILAGTGTDNTRVSVELDRRTAIHQALELARPGDAVLIAGKGHETEQIIGQTRTHFDDAEVIREFFGVKPSAMTPHGRKQQSPAERL